MKENANIPLGSEGSTHAHAASTWHILGDYTAAPPALVPGCSWGNSSPPVLGVDGGCRGETKLF